MTDFARGFLASCCAAGLAMVGAGAVIIVLDVGSLDVGSTKWMGVFVPAGFTTMLAVPATLVGWLCVRQVPVRLVNAVSVALIGGLLGLATMLALVVAGLPQRGSTSEERAWAVLSCICGVCGASAAWWAGFRREVRVR